VLGPEEAAPPPPPPLPSLTKPGVSLPALLGPGVAPDAPPPSSLSADDDADDSFPLPDAPPPNIPGSCGCIASSVSDTLTELLFFLNQPFIFDHSRTLIATIFTTPTKQFQPLVFSLKGKHSVELKK
jgi:hypothetical protein